jgi:hypothetical protein
MSLATVVVVLGELVEADIDVCGWDSVSVGPDIARSSGLARKCKT